jgi:RNA polymerase sigma factor (sigma-70 family)
MQVTGSGAPHGSARPSDAAAGSSAMARDFVRWRGGDPQALESLVRGFTGVLWHVARASGLDAAAAEDVVQLTWLALVRHADSIRDPQALPGWLITSARRLAVRTARAGQREVTALDEEVLERPGADGSGPEDLVVASEEAGVLWRHVTRLSERCQRLLRVVAFAHRPEYTSLAAELNMPVGGIGPTRRRCLDKLRTALDGDPDWSRR